MGGGGAHGWKKPRRQCQTLFIQWGWGQVGTRQSNPVCPVTPPRMCQGPSLASTSLLPSSISIPNETFMTHHPNSSPLGLQQIRLGGRWGAGDTGERRFCFSQLRLFTAPGLEHWEPAGTLALPPPPRATWHESLESPLPAQPGSDQREAHARQHFGSLSPPSPNQRSRPHHPPQAQHTTVLLSFVQETASDGRYL